MAALPSLVSLTEVGPRDGLQNEAQALPVALKLELIERLSAAGLSTIEVAAFVSPRRVPQMADGAQVLAGVRRRPGLRLSVLVPNLRGLEAALDGQPDEVGVFAAASEAFSQNNIHCSIAESIERFAPVCERAKAQGIAIRGSISCALGCPYQGDVAPAAVADVARKLKAIGVDTLSVADTIGVGTPHAVQQAMEAALTVFSIDRVGAHFHDTYGQALANVYACLQMGIAQFDASVAGLGGCPFAPGATGNVATEDVLYLMRGLQIDTGVDLDQVVATGQWIGAQLGRPVASRAGRALAARAQTVAFGPVVKMP